MYHHPLNRQEDILVRSHQFEGNVYSMAVIRSLCSTGRGRNVVACDLVLFIGQQLVVELL